MTNDLAPDRLHNQPPLAEQLALETEALRAEAVKLLTTYGVSRITDDKSAGDVLTLSKQLADLISEIADMRTDREKPLKSDMRVIRDFFVGLTFHLSAAETNCRAMLATWNNLRKQEAARARQEAEDVARKAQAEADASQERARDALSAKERLAAIKAQEEAEAARRRLEEAAAPLQPIQSDAATLGTSREIKFSIGNDAAALRWATKAAKAEIMATVEKIARVELRRLGVAKVDDPQWKGIPGVTVWIEERMVRR